jgi:hypothetical protein
VTTAPKAPVCDAQVAIVGPGGAIEQAKQFGCEFVGAGEGHGPYRVMARAPGFEPTELGVVLRRDECHVIPQYVTVTLRPK